MFRCTLVSVVKLKKSDKRSLALFFNERAPSKRARTCEERAVLANERGTSDKSNGVGGRGKLTEEDAQQPTTTAGLSERASFDEVRGTSARHCGANERPENGVSRQARHCPSERRTTTAARRDYAGGTSAAGVSEAGREEPH